MSQLQVPVLIGEWLPPVSAESALVSVVHLGPPPLTGALGVARFLHGSEHQHRLHGSEHQHRLELSCSLKDHGGRQGRRWQSRPSEAERLGTRESTGQLVHLLPLMSPFAVTSAGVFAP